MRIGLDLYFRQKKAAGINNHIEGLVNNLLKIDKEDTFFAIGEDQYEFDLHGERNIAMTLDYTNRYDFMAYIYQLDIIHSVFYPFYDLKYPCKKILTVHDLIPLIFEDKKWGAYSADFYRGPICKSVQQADAIIAVSESTKQDIVYYFDIKPDKVHVIYNGLYKPIFSDILDQGEQHIENYLLSVSTMGPYKNFKGLIRAFVIYKERHRGDELKLVLTGKVGWQGFVDDEIPELNKYKKDIIFTGYVTDEELYHLYKNAKAFVFPSFYEGFGLPILEAMSIGKAVISSNTSSMPEVGGDAVEYCNPNEIESMVEAMEHVVLNDSRRIALEQRAKIRAAKFSCEKNARETLGLYHQVMEG